ncbi:MAG: ribose-5-phosphate isomerase RpiA [Candidatus Caldarchaeum sp.]|nr:ribose-5-phosphate isomerase RpiA [Candidatus Caldarchaeum sp.]
MSAKRRAAEQAVEYVEDGFVVGLGSGSTVSLIIEAIANSGMKVKLIPASWQSYYECVAAGLEVVSIDQSPHPDLYLDSFDQVTESGYMIKGGGGAMLREKVLAAASKLRIFVGDSNKLVEKLSRPVPLEIIPFAYRFVEGKINELGARLELRTSAAKNGPTISDNGHFIADADFGPIHDPVSVERNLRNIPGIVENGLFIGLADQIIIAYEDGKTIRHSYR